MRKIFLISVSIFLILISTISATRLPVVNGDSNAWGTILNAYLNVSHNESGNLRNIDNTLLGIVNLFGNISLNDTLFVRGNGDIGIGTSNPLSIVHIKEQDLGLTIDHFPGSNSHGFLTIEEEDARLGLFSKNMGGYGSTILMNEVNAGNFTDQWSVGRLASGFNSTFEIKYGTDPDFTISPAKLSIGKTGKFGLMGTVGIGTVNPQTLFHVYGSNPKITVDDSTDSEPAVYWAKNHTNKAAIGLEATTNDLIFFTNNGTWNERMTIEQNGSIGIGTLNPLSIVHIQEQDLNLTIDHFPGSNSHGFLTVEDEDARLGLFSRNEGGHGSTILMNEVNAGNFSDQWAIGRLSSGFNSTFEIKYGTDPDFTISPVKMQISKTGKFGLMGTVGIGTVNPQTLFHIYGSDPKITVDDSTDGNPAVYWAKNHTNKAAIGIVTSTNDLTFYTNDGTWHERMRIQQNGSIGIGTSNPTDKLNVVGNVNVTGNITADYKSSDGSLGITNTSSYWLCTSSNCATTCQAQIKDGLIVGCI